MTIRVRYCETDAMGLVHHATYVNYFEIGRTELYRSQGGNYREFESRGLYFVVVSLECKYKAPARYDDVLTVRTRLRRMTPVKLEHEYQVLRDEQLLTTGRTVLACVDREGRVQRLSDELLFGDVQGNKDPIQA
ncbi:MAG: acyl-CoA thioesterase [Planctomycetaceae bacterium]